MFEKSPNMLTRLRLRGMNVCSKFNSHPSNSCQEISIKTLSRIHPLGTMNICPVSHDNLSRSCSVISTWTKVVHTAGLAKICYFTSGQTVSEKSNTVIKAKDQCSQGKKRCHLCSKLEHNIWWLNEQCSGLSWNLLNIYEDVSTAEIFNCKRFLPCLVNNRIHQVGTLLAVTAEAIIFCSERFHPDQMIAIRERTHTARHHHDSHALNSRVHEVEHVSAY